MARTFTSREAIPLSKGMDVWAKLAVMEEYALTKVGDNPSRSVRVTDVRGEDEVSSVEAAREAWLEHQHALQLIFCHYTPSRPGDPTVFIFVQVMPPMPPQITVQASSADAADARGLAAELADRGRRVGNPRASSTHSKSPRAVALRATAAHPLVTAVVGGALATVLGSYLYNRFLT